MSGYSKEGPTLTDKLRFWIWAIVLPTYIFIASIIYIFVAWVFNPFIPSSALWVKCMLFKVVAYVMGFNAELRDGKKLINAPKGVLVMNHQSIWDLGVFMSIYSELGDILHPAIKSEVFYYWPLGYAFHLSGALFIDRKTPKSALESLIFMSKKIFSSSNPLRSKVVIFPEGTRNPKLGGDLLPFKKGAFKVAQACNVPVIPMVCSPHNFIKNFVYLRPAKLIIRCLDPVIIDPNADLDPQIETIRCNMQREYTKLINELGITPEK